jgi:hypothetical protein
MMALFLGLGLMASNAEGSEPFRLDAPLHPFPSPRTEVSYSVNCGRQKATFVFLNTYRFVEGRSGYQAFFVRLGTSWRPVAREEEAELEKLFAGLARVEGIKGRCWEKDILLDVHGYRKADYDAAGTGADDTAPLVRRVVTVRARRGVYISPDR